MDEEEIGSAIENKESSLNNLKIKEQLQLKEKEQDNLTDDEKNVLKKLVKSLKEEAAKNRR